MDALVAQNALETRIASWQSQGQHVECSLEIDAVTHTATTLEDDTSVIIQGHKIIRPTKSLSQLLE